MRVGPIYSGSGRAHAPGSPKLLEARSTGEHQTPFWALAWGAFALTTEYLHYYCECYKLQVLYSLLLLLNSLKCCQLPATPVTNSTQIINRVMLSEPASASLTWRPHGTAPFCGSGSRIAGRGIKHYRGPWA